MIFVKKSKRNFYQDLVIKKWVFECNQFMLYQDFRFLNFFLSFSIPKINNKKNYYLKGCADEGEEDPIVEKFKHLLQNDPSW